MSIKSQIKKKVSKNHLFYQMSEQSNSYKTETYSINNDMR